ncbi:MULTISPECIES: beta-galactosidase [Microbacterium]|uniref:beta-galactosidase n=1 Tax=Microbacterium TaxID=33882 RepID=UPI00214B9FB6|nr:MULTISPECIES: beta-galactosidase [unclassified Microbacterium]MCR2813817.1 beta-galactosidase [Microbacterium sp. zg.Y1084]MDL5487517.1 beta-galactosidase [Microbacterium sp. zg-Y1211]
MTLPAVAGIPYGGDYTPEQWAEQVWDADYRAFDLAGIDLLTVGVFTWALTQPDEDTYDFSTLTRILDRAHAEGRRVCLATGTAAVPPWLAHRHPDVCRTDFEGRRHVYGVRHNACPSSPAYRRLAAAVAGRIAERFADHPAVVAWHINNEYGGVCYCDLCAVEFRQWLRDRHGSLERLNDAWNTTFWSHRFSDWDQVVPPNALSEHWRGPDHTAFQGVTLDYLRFNTDNLLRTFREEKDAIRAHSPLPVTTNMMAIYRQLDYHRWAPHLDFASWDNYPTDGSPVSRMALSHALMRGLKDGQPFWLMEQTPTMTATRDHNPVKRPGVMRLWSWQAVAHGADSVLFFQMRHSRGAAEKYHGAVLNHAGRTDTRAFREVAGLGAELRRVGDRLQNARTPARVAVLFDWDSWWALEMSDGYSRAVKYEKQLVSYHEALWQAGAIVDVVGVGADLSRYDVVVAPFLHLLKGDIAARVDDVARRGGTVLTTVMSGRVDEDDNAFLADVPGPFAATFGVRVDETDSLPPDAANPVVLSLPGQEQATAQARLVFDLVMPQGAEVVGRYTEDFYAGTPAVTRNAHGRGSAWYVGAVLDQAGVDWVVRRVLAEQQALGPFADVADLEHTTRTVDGARYEFVLNHRAGPVRVSSPFAGTDLLTGRHIAVGDDLDLAATDVAVIAVS